MTSSGSGTCPRSSWSSSSSCLSASRSCSDTGRNLRTTSRPGCRSTSPAGAGLTAVAGLLAVALVLTLVEELVYRVTIQERLSWFVGTPVAILVTAILFALAHAVGTLWKPAGGPLSEILPGVLLDGVLLGIIYAKTHNLAVTWATDYAADVVGLILLVSVYRAL